MQLQRLTSSILSACYLSCVALSLLCASCNEKPKYKKKHYTDKRVVRHYKRSDAMLATATNKEKIKEDEKTLDHKPISVNKPKPADKLKHSTVKKKPTVRIIKKRQNKYFIIASSHSSETKAIQMSQKYIKLGFPVEIISSKDKFRVTLKSVRSKQKAIQLRDSLRTKLNRKDFWLLRY